MEVDALYFAFSLVSIVLLTDGMLLKKEKLQKLTAQVIKKNNTEKTISLVSNFLVTTGVITLIWTAIGYILSNQLLLEIFILVYVAIILISGMFLFAIIKKRY